MSRFAAGLVGLCMAALGAILAISALLPWYAVDLPARSLSASGVEGSGELWLLLVFGAAILAAGVAVASNVGATTREWAGILCAAAGAGAAFIALRAAVFSRVEVAIQSGNENTPTGIVAQTLPVGFVSLSVALAAVVVGLYVRQVADRRSLA